MYFGIGLSLSFVSFSLLTLFNIIFKPKTGLAFFINPNTKKIGFLVIFFNSLNKIKNSFSMYALFPFIIKRFIIFGAQNELNK